MVSASPASLFVAAANVARLLHVYESRIEGTSARGRDGQSVEAFTEALERELPRIVRQIEAGTFRFTTYREITLSRGANKAPRVISVATVRDRLVLRWLAELLYTIYPEIKRPIAPVLTRQLSAELTSGKYVSFVKLDIRDFYSSINHDAVLRALRGRIRKRQFLDIIVRAIQTPTASATTRTSDLKPSNRGVPQGLSISNVLADLAMSNLDRRMVKREGIAYFRFVDDIIVLSASGDTASLRSDIVRYCRAIGVSVHAEDAEGSKSYSGKISGVIDYLGYVYRDGTVTVRKASVERLRQTLLRAYTRYKYAMRRAGDAKDLKVIARSELDWKLDLIISGCIFDHQARGWLHYFSQVTDLQMLQSLDSFVRRQDERFGLLDARRKRLVKAYWLINNPSAATEAYVPNFDRWSIEEKRQLLSEILGIKDLDRWQNAEVIAVFRARVSRIVEELERDLKFLS